jgi:hypothetical protein
MSHSHPRVTGYIPGVWAEVVEEAMARADAGAGATIIVFPARTTPKPWRLSQGGDFIGSFETPEDALEAVKTVLPNASLAKSGDLIVGSHIRGGETFAIHYRLARSI